MTRTLRPEHFPDDSDERKDRDARERDARRGRRDTLATRTSMTRTFVIRNLVTRTLVTRTSMTRTWTTRTRDLMTRTFVARNLVTRTWRTRIRNLMTRALVTRTASWQAGPCKAKEYPARRHPNDSDGAAAGRTLMTRTVPPTRTKSSDAASPCPSPVPSVTSRQPCPVTASHGPSVTFLHKKNASQSRSRRITQVSSESVTSHL